MSEEFEASRQSPFLSRSSGWAARLLHQTFQWSAIAGVVGFLFIGILTSIDVVVLRSILNRPIAGSNEPLQTIFAVAIAAVLASGTIRRAHLRVDVIEKYTSSRAKLWLNVAGSTLTLLFFVIISWQVFDQAHASIVRQARTIIFELPLGQFQIAISILLLLCVPAQLLVAVEDTQLALTSQTGQPSDLHVIIVLLFLVIFAACGLYLALIGLEPLAAASPVLFGASLFVLIWFLVLATIPVGVALTIVGIIGTSGLIGIPGALKVLGSETTNLFANAELALIPLFLIMGSFAIVSRLSEDAYRFSQAALGSFKGGLAMATIGGSASFGALTGSSIATAVTIGSFSLPEMRKRGYEPGFAAGCVAAGATLGVLVPPSTIVVLYAILTEQSIGQLYLAILIPALISIVFYLVTIAMVARLRGRLIPDSKPFSLRELVVSFRRTLALFVLFGIIMGGIFAGVFTPTEAAAVGAILAFLIALFRRTINKSNFLALASETTQSVSMIYVLIIGALMAAYAFALTGVPNAIALGILESGLPPMGVVAMLCSAYVLLGTVMDSVTIMLITASIVAPIIERLGFNPLWWGVITVMVVELGVLTPPFGINLFLLKQMSPETPISRIYWGVIPFVVADIVKVAILLAAPILILWLPGIALK